jgi:hypothetical protein
MQTKKFRSFVAIALLVGTVASLTTTSGVVAAQTTNSSNIEINNSNNCQENDLSGNDVNSASAAESDDGDDGGSSATAEDDADEPGDNDVNDEEDSDTSNEDVGEANDDEDTKGGEQQNSDVGGATDSKSANDNSGDVVGQFPLPNFDPCNYSNDGIVNNPHFTLTPGTAFTYEGETEDGKEKNIVMVTNETKEILGINATVVWDRVWLEDELTEETFDWFAQDKEGNVWYLGEDSKEFENGQVTTTEGSWEAGVDGAKPGIIMESNPQVGDKYRQEFYKGHAEDQAEVISLNETATVPFGTFTNCLRTSESTPLEPTTGDEDKYYCTDVGGVVLEVGIESGERSELTDFSQNVSGGTAA